MLSWHTLSMDCYRQHLLCARPDSSATFVRGLRSAKCSSQWKATVSVAVLTLKNKLQLVLGAEMHELFQTGPLEHGDDTRPWIVEVYWLLSFVKILYQCCYTLLIQGKQIGKATWLQIFISRMKDQLDVTCYFISLLMCTTCFRH